MSDASPLPATPVSKSEALQQQPEFKSETLQILSRVGEKPVAEVAGDEKLEKALVRDWTIAEQLRHPVGIVSLQWTPGSLQRGQSCLMIMNSLHQPSQMSFFCVTKRVHHSHIVLIKLTRPAMQVRQYPYGKSAPLKLISHLQRSLHPV